MKMSLGVYVSVKSRIETAVKSALNLKHWDKRCFRGVDKDCARELGRPYGA
jgi:hypothetical protein